MCDEGWLPDREVGSSGQSVAPKLYLARRRRCDPACGRHEGARIVAANNKDQNAPVFEIVPALVDLLEQK